MSGRKKPELVEVRVELTKKHAAAAFGFVYPLLSFGGAMLAREALQAL